MCSSVAVTPGSSWRPAHMSARGRCRRPGGRGGRGLGVNGPASPDESGSRPLRQACRREAPRRLMTCRREAHRRLTTNPEVKITDR